MSYVPKCQPQKVINAYLPEKCDRKYMKLLDTIFKQLDKGYAVSIVKERKHLALQLLAKTYGLQKDCLLIIEQDCCNCILWKPDCICTYLGYHTQRKTFDEPYEGNVCIELDYDPVFPSCVFIVKNGHLILHEGLHFSVSDRKITLKWGNPNAKEDCPDEYCIYYEYRSADTCPTCGYDCKVETFPSSYTAGQTIALDDPFLIPSSVRVFMKGRFLLKPGRDFLINLKGEVQLLFDGVVEPECPHEFLITWAYYGEPSDFCPFKNKKCECVDVEAVPTGYMFPLQECPCPGSTEIYWACVDDSSSGVSTFALTPRKEGMAAEDWDYYVEQNMVVLNPTWESEKPGRFCVRYSY